MRKLKLKWSIVLFTLLLKAFVDCFLYLKHYNFLTDGGEKTATKAVKYQFFVLEFHFASHRCHNFLYTPCSRNNLVWIDERFIDSFVTLKVVQSVSIVGRLDQFNQ